MNPPQITPNPNSYVPPVTGGQSNSIPSATPPAPNVPPLSSAQISDTDSSGNNPYLATQMMSYMNAKMSSVNSLNTVRNAMIQSRFSSTGLTPDQISSLDPNTQAIINSGNKGLQDMYLQSINDQIQGQSNSMAANMSFIQTGYQQAIQDAETQKNDAISSLTAVINAGGSSDALQALKGLFPGASDLIDSFDPTSQVSGLGQYSTLTVNPSDAADMGKLNNAISTEESGGSYTAGNPAAGPSTALGKYQIVPSDWFSTIINPATGKPLDPNSEADRQTFLNNPQLQDQAFNNVIGYYLKQNGNNLPRAVASYFAGSNGKFVGTALGDTIKDSDGTSINQYVSNVLSAYTGGQVSIGGGSGAGGSAGSSAAGSTGATSQSVAQSSPYGLLATVKGFNPTNQVDADAANYLTNYLSGNPPSSSSGMGGAATFQQKQRIQTRAENLYFDATGQKLPNQSLLTSNLGLISNNNNLLNNLNVQTGTIKQNGLLDLNNLNSNNINSSWPVINKMVNGLAAATGSSNVAQYLSQNETLQNELASLLSVKNASGTTVADKLSSSDILPSGATPKQIQQILTTLMTEADNQSKTILNTNAQLYIQTDPLALNPQNPVNNTITLSDDEGNEYQAQPGQLTPSQLQQLFDAGGTIVSQQ